MAFVVPPPGIPGPQAAPPMPAAPTELTQIFQMMQAQMQAQQAQQVQQMQQQQAQQQQVADMLKVMLQMQTNNLPPVGSNVNVTSNKGLDEKHFRRINKFDNKGESWKEWRTHFMTAVRESSPIMAEVMEKAEASDYPIQDDEVLKTDSSYSGALDLKHVLYARLVSLTTGVSFAMVESSSGHGIEAWRLLSQKYNPRTHSRCVQLVLNIVNFKINKMEDVLTGLVRWEGQVAALSRDHKEVLTEKLRIAFMLKILPTSLQERIAEHLDRLTTYNEVHDKIVSLVQSSSRYNLGDAMDCSAVDYGDYGQDEDADVNALSQNHCARCGGFGHYARECSTPNGKAAKGAGKQRSSAADDQPTTGKGNTVCTHCKRSGHSKDKCWDLYPELKRKGKGKGKTRRVAGVDEEEAQDDGEEVGFIEIGSFECSPCGGRADRPLCRDHGPSGSGCDSGVSSTVYYSFPDVTTTRTKTSPKNQRKLFLKPSTTFQTLRFQRKVISRS